METLHVGTCPSGLQVDNGFAAQDPASRPQMWATLCLGHMSLPWIARLKRSGSLRHQRRKQHQTVSLTHFALPHLIGDVVHTNMQVPSGNLLGIPAKRPDNPESGSGS